MLIWVKGLTLVGKSLPALSALTDRLHRVIPFLLMATRVINVRIEKEQALYEELYSAMMQHREYDGCYVMQYNEYQEGGWTTASFMVRDARQPSEESE